MKKFFSTLVVFSVVLLIGCQESLINEPENTSLDKRVESVTKDVIKICCEVQDPLSGQCNLSGDLEYEHRIINRAMNPLGLNEVALHLEMDSELCDLLGMVHAEWKVQGCCDDVIYVSEEGIVILEKEYNITNREDVRLYVNYLVTTEGVGIAEIWIEEVN